MVELPSGGGGVWVSDLLEFDDSSLRPKQQAKAKEKRQPK